MFQELTESKFVNDASIRDLTAKLSISEEEGKKMRQDVQQLRRDNSELEAELHRFVCSRNTIIADLFLFITIMRAIKS